MYLLFLQTEEELKPLFAYSDKDAVLYHNIGIENIKNLILQMLPSSAKIYKHYAGNYKFKDANEGNFYALVRIIDGKVDTVLRIDASLYDSESYYELLNQENNNENRTYKIFKFVGMLDID